MQTHTRKQNHSIIFTLYLFIYNTCKIYRGFEHTTVDSSLIAYYEDTQYYKPHTDAAMQFLAFSYFHKEPKKFSGGDLIFPKYDYRFECPNNSLIMMPGWVEHGVSKVNIEDSEYYDGYGRYSITSFFGNKKA